VNPDHLRRLIRETLHELPALVTSAAVELLILTACQESHCGEWLYQLGGGPARGIFQMEPATHDDLWSRWLRHQTPWRLDVARLLYGVDAGAGGVLSMEFGRGQLAGNLTYAIATCRAQYWRHPVPLPAADDAHGLARYWYEAWCKGCKGTVEEALGNYRKLGGGDG